MTPPVYIAVPLLVYVAAPYSDPDEEGVVRNVEEAMHAGYEILLRGHYPLIPHLNHYYDRWRERTIGSRAEPQHYYDWDNVLLGRCDALLYLRPTLSRGANRELAWARDNGLTIYTSVNDLPGIAK